jgi:prevent-host-death family protein
LANLQKVILMTRKPPVSAPAIARHARDQFSEAVKRAARNKERVVIKHRKKPVAAVVPLEDLRLLEQLEDHLDLTDFRAARRAAGREGFKPLEEVLRKLLPVAEELYQAKESGTREAPGSMGADPD